MPPRLRSGSSGAGAIDRRIFPTSISRPTPDAHSKERCAPQGVVCARNSSMVSAKGFRKPLWSLAARLCLVAAPDFACAADAPGVVWPNAAKIATIGDSTLSVRVTSRDAGAIDGLVWRGKQFVSSSDHGREIQMAAAFSNRHRECFNPTEAGSVYDGLGATSTSRLLSLKVEPRRVTTETRAAYWLDPTDFAKCPATDGPKDGPLSSDIMRKVVTIGVVGLPNVIEFQSTFVVPDSCERSAALKPQPAICRPNFRIFGSMIRQKISSSGSWESLATRTIRSSSPLMTVDLRWEFTRRRKAFRRPIPDSHSPMRKWLSRA